MDGSRLWKVLSNANFLPQGLVLLLELVKLVLIDFLRSHAILLIEDVAEEKIIILPSSFVQALCSPLATCIGLFERHQITNLLKPDASSVHRLSCSCESGLRWTVRGHGGSILQCRVSSLAQYGLGHRHLLTEGWSVVIAILFEIEQACLSTWCSDANRVLPPIQCPVHVVGVDREHVE